MSTRRYFGPCCRNCCRLGIVTERGDLVLGEGLRGASGSVHNSGRGRIPRRRQVGGNTTVVVTPPIVTTRGGGWMLDVSVKVAVVSPELIGIFQSKISIDTQTQAFRGLLGTYHAAGPAYLLAQYRSLFDMQYISKIRVWSYLGGP